MTTPELGPVSGFLLVDQVTYRLAARGGTLRLAASGSRGLRGTATVSVTAYADDAAATAAPRDLPVVLVEDPASPGQYAATLTLPAGVASVERAVVTLAEDGGASRQATVWERSLAVAGAVDAAAANDADAVRSLVVSGSGGGAWLSYNGGRQLVDGFGSLPGGTGERVEMRDRDGLVAGSVAGVRVPAGRVVRVDVPVRLGSIPVLSLPSGDAFSRYGTFELRKGDEVLASRYAYGTAGGGTVDFGTTTLREGDDAVLVHRGEEAGATFSGDFTAYRRETRLPLPDVARGRFPVTMERGHAAAVRAHRPGHRRRRGRRRGRGGRDAVRRRPVLVLPEHHRARRDLPVAAARGRRLGRRDRSR